LKLGARGLKLGIPMSFATSLECSRCREAFSPDELHGLCSLCESPLLVRYDLERAAVGSLREEFLRRPPTLWRYRELLPVREPDSIVSMGEGMTPLVQLKPTLAEGSVAQLWLKDESCNPTGSFKARGLSVAVTMAASFGVRRLCVPSAGNAGGALAAYAARCGLESYVFIPKDTPAANIVECMLAATRVEMVDGTISDAASAMRQRRGDRDWFDVSTLREPYRIEGKKTLGYEIAEQMGWNLPDVILFPTGGGTGVIGMWKAFQEMESMGWVGKQLPKMVAVQSEGCAPIVGAFDRGLSAAQPWSDPQTFAAGIRVPHPLGDFLILRALRESGGTAVAVSEESIEDAIRELAEKEGLLMCPEGAACWAAFRKLLQSGWIQPDAVVVLFNTAAGCKYLDSLKRITLRAPSGLSPRNANGLKGGQGGD
jgi:threonine synthase